VPAANQACYSKLPTSTKQTPKLPLPRKKKKNFSHKTLPSSPAFAAFPTPLPHLLAVECMPSAPPAPRRHPRPTKNQRIARREAREAAPRDSPLSTNHAAFLQLASLQFQALARQTAARRVSRSRSPPREHRRRIRSRSPLRSSVDRSPPGNQRERATPQPGRNSPSAHCYNPFTITRGRDPSHPQEAAAAAPPPPKAEEESVIGWSDYDRERRPEESRRTDSYRPAYGRNTRGARGNRRFQGNRGPPRSLFDRITPRD
jgi:hypothetical protein